jgi:hypothetical protein
LTEGRSVRYAQKQGKRVLFGNVTTPGRMTLCPQDNQAVKEGVNVKARAEVEAADADPRTVSASTAENARPINQANRASNRNAQNVAAKWGESESLVRQSPYPRAAVGWSDRPDDQVKKEAQAMYDKKELFEKIREIYPDIGECGIDVDVEYDEAKKAWIVDLKKDQHELKTHV